MKRLKFHRAIVAIAMMLIGWLPSLAHDFEVNGIFYDKLNSSKVAVTYKGEDYYDYSNEYAGDVVIPSSVNYNGTTYSVTSIESSAFCRCSSLTSIEIPNSVTSIGINAFANCTSLTSIVVDVGNSKYDSRNGCNAIIETASNTLIAGCQNTIIPNSVTSIGYWAFYECSNLTGIEIPNSVTSIGEWAFSHCSSLTSIEIPNSVTSIGNSAFSSCKSLTSIVVDAGNTIYDSRNGCNAIIETASNTLIVGCKNTIIPNSITSIGTSAFYSCTSLTSIEIPNSVTSIGDSAFYYCKSLTSVVIGNSVTSIGNSVFSGCTSLTSIVVDAGNSKYDSRNGCNAIIETASNTLIAGCQNTIIPNSVTNIGDYAFYKCSNLTGIVIPNSVTSIGREAFSNCRSLTNVVIGNSVTSIGDNAFTYCSSLTSIVVDAGNTKYDSWNECNAIIETASNTLIAGCQNTIIPNNVTSIGNYAFSGCTSLTSIEIPNSVTSIGNSAFYYCDSLTSVVIGNSVTSIGDAAFYGCDSLTSIVIPNSVTSIGEKAFYKCSGLTRIEIPNSVTSIGDYAFHECTSLTSIEIGNSVTSIGYYAFSCCYRLTEIKCWATTPPTIYYNTFSSYSADLYVPVRCKWAYKIANYWTNFNNIIESTVENPITLNDNNVTVASIGDYIVVKNATAGSLVRVYTADGAMIASEVATEGDVIIEVPAKGIYVVKVGKQTVKVII